MDFRKNCLLLALAAAALGLAARSAAAPETKRPNILLIMSDDMGYSDLGCYGGEIRTPNLDRLAKNGLRFTQFYNTARCCPTRAALLSGLYPHQAGVGHMMNDRGHDGYRGELNRSCVTIAEALKPAGYATYMLGKWHLTKAVRPDGPKDNWPLQRGFDRYYGTIVGGGSFWDPNGLTRDNTMVSAHGDPEYRPKRFYYTEALSDHAVRFIGEHGQKKSDQPFFMYLAYTAAHWPMHALDDDIAKYKGQFDQGYEPLRKARYERMKKLGLIDPAWALSPGAREWGKAENKAWEARCMEVYAAMIDRMDQGIGRIVETLRRNGQLDNTLILFLQDNGGCAEIMGRQLRNTPGEYAVRPEKPPFPPMPADALQLDMIPKQTRDGYPTIMGPGAMPGPDGTFIAYGQGWANVSNTPFREYKHWVHEGGISTPLIAHWPARIRRRGKLEPQPGHLVDIMATCVDAAGAAYPKEHRGQPIRPMEGRSLVPAFEGKAIQRDALYWEHEGNRAIRVGRWKLVAKEDQPWELYDMERDRTELHDLASSQPERVRELSAKWDAWAARSNVLPLGTWKAPLARAGGAGRRRARPAGP
jgi:arylsulfatase A-like enzyme